MKVGEEKGRGRELERERGREREREEREWERERERERDIHPPIPLLFPRITQWGGQANFTYPVTPTTAAIQQHNITTMSYTLKHTYSTSLKANHTAEGSSCSVTTTHTKLCNFTTMGSMYVWGVGYIHDEGTPSDV